MPSPASHSTPFSKSPAFQFYANDFVSGCAALSTEEIGAYILLMCHCWDKGSIPGGDMTLLARIAKLSPAKMRRAWLTLSSKFQTTDSYNFVQPRLEKVRHTQLEFRRRQTDNGKKGGRPTKPKPTPNPDVTQTEPKPEPTPNPNKSSPVSGLRSLNQEKSAGVGNGPDPETKALAFELQEIYPEVFAACRTSAVYRTVQALQDRDGPKYYALAELYPDIRKLRAMLEIFLKRDMGDKNSPGTPGQFLNMAPVCDEILQRSGWKP